MSTKDISRSALEGGRANYNKYERNESHRAERSQAKVWLDNVRFDDDTAEDSDPEPRMPVSKGFTDKLNPCYRWLASRCGQPWSKVFSELSEKFDTRNLASWHIVNQHMLSDVQGAGTARDGNLGLYRSHRFFIDDGGVLRDRGKYAWRNTKPPRPRKVYTGPSEASVLAVANGRKVVDGVYGSKVMYWALPNLAGDWKPCKGRHCDISKHLHRSVETTQAALIEKYKTPGLRSLGEGDWWRSFRTEHLVLPAWRVHRRFTKQEMQWWESISRDIRGLLTVYR